MSHDWTPVPAEGHRHFIDGEFIEPTSTATVAIVDPATEETIARVPRATPTDADAAISAARAAYDEGPWQRLTSDERADALDRFADALEARRGLLESIALRQGGAVAQLAKNLQTGFPLHMARRYATLTRTFPMVEHSSLSGSQAAGRSARVVQRVPAGVVAGITPFNYPLLVNVQKVFPALAVGCSVILKPTPGTSLDAAVMAEAAQEAGLPRGVFNVLLGGEPDVGEMLVTDPRVDLITFTGSTATGKRIMALASNQVKRVLLELGGKSPNIVFADTDLEHWFATQPGNLRHAGQGCGQLTRILVEDEIYDDVVDRLAADMSKLVVGPPDDPDTDVGPVANARQYERVMNYIQIGIDEGARLVTGGGRPPGLDKGYYIEPTLFADVDNSMRIAREEIFGPVPVVIRFSGEDQAVAIANDSDYGINASVWSGDDEKARRVAGRILAGNVGVNCMANVTEGPHGGFKQTGIGREYWEWSLEEYVELRGLSFA